MYESPGGFAPVAAIAGIVSDSTVPDMLKISGLKLLYGDVPALEDINLEVAEREFVALLGPSGCGKTSLLRSIAGFNTPQQGQIILSGVDVARLAPRDRSIGIVFQNYALFPHMTALQNVAFGLECRRLPREEVRQRAMAALDRVRLSAFADRHPRHMSGGQQQRVALARAVAIEPKLLLLDEPLGALDKQLRVRMQSELKELQRSLGIAAIFVTHDQEEAIAMADRIVVMRDRRIQQTATPTELFERPASAWVAEFMDAGNLLSGEIVEENGNWSITLPGNLVLSAPAPKIRAANGAKLLLPEHRLEVTSADGPSPYSIEAMKPSGLAVAVRIRWADGVFRAQLPVQRMQDLSLGQAVHLSAAQGAGTWLKADALRADTV